MNQVIIPENYHSVLSMYETQDAIGIIKEMMQKKLCMGTAFEKSHSSAVCRSGIRTERRSERSGTTPGFF